MAWNTQHGPFSGIRTLESDIKTPLKKVWDIKKVGTSICDGRIVSAGGLGFVPIKKKDVLAVDLETGKKVWQVKGVRDGMSIVCDENWVVAIDGVLFHAWNGLHHSVRTNPIRSTPRAHSRFWSCR